MSTLIFILEVGILGVLATTVCMTAGLCLATLFDGIDERK